jgi:hypothetical protein
MNHEDDFDSEDDFDPPEDPWSRIEDLSWRVEHLESSTEESGSHRRDGVGLVYALGMAIAVTLSWARNASILWCILHGILSWGYVIYFAMTRP